MSEKSSVYEQLHKDAWAVLDGEPNMIARMATVSCLLAQAFPENIWTGFYLVDTDNPRELVVGPYQGSLGCLRISFDKGVCGAAARTGETQIVDDVHDFPGHIACDARSVSEIVVPVRNAQGDLYAVLDIDSAERATFDEADKAGLEILIGTIFV